MSSVNESSASYLSASRKQKVLVPVLRFPEFNGEWREILLDDFAKRGSGHTPSKSHSKYYNGDIYWVSLTDSSKLDKGLIENTNKKITQLGIKNSSAVLHPEGTVILSRDAGIGKSAVMKYPMAVSQHFIVWVAKDGVSSNWFLYNWLQIRKPEFERIAIGNTIKTIGLPYFKKLKIVAPNFPEQQKIAHFLTTVDTKIQQLQQKQTLLQQYKKGVMQQLFRQALRFKDDEGGDYPDWEEKRLGDLFERVKRKNTKNCLNTMTISAQQGLINQEEYFNKLVSAKDVSGYYLLKKGEFAYNKSYSTGYPMGAIKKLNRYSEGVVSTLYICFKAKSNVVPEFYEQYFESGRLNSEIHKIAQEGARNHGLLNVSVVEFFRDIVVMYPSIEEQQKIANFLTAIDDKITQTTQQLEQAQTFKKGLLQQMFV